MSAPSRQEDFVRRATGGPIQFVTLCPSVRYACRGGRDFFARLRGSSRIFLSLGALQILGPNPVLVASGSYDNRFVAIPSEVTYRPQTEDGRGV